MGTAEIMESAWREHLRSGRRSGSITRTYLWASGRKDCLRRMALDLLHPENQEEFSEDTLERFRRGEEREASVVNRLMQIGPRAAEPFAVIEGQRRFEVKDRDGVLLITGKIDGRLRFERQGSRPVFEVKSGQSVANVESLEDLNKSVWTRHHLDQLLVYLLAESEPVGILILDRPRVPKFLEVRLEEHLERAEGFLKDARVAIDARMGAGPLPGFTEDLSLCRNCPHLGKVCAPPVSFGDGIQFVTDPRLVQAAEDRAKYQDAADRFEEADKELKEALRGVERALVGPLVAIGKPRAQTTYDIPKEIKDRYKKTNPEGSWTIRFEKHGITD